jgi:hypothetical protein
VTTHGAGHAGAVLRAHIAIGTDRVYRMMSVIDIEVAVYAPTAVPALAAVPAGHGNLVPTNLAGDAGAMLRALPTPGTGRVYRVVSGPATGV